MGVKAPQPWSLEKYGPPPAERPPPPPPKKYPQRPAETRNMTTILLWSLQRDDRPVDDM
jgi:hypothetical protein